MSKMKSILHTILYDYIPFYEYREEFCCINILEKIKLLKFFLFIYKVNANTDLINRCQ